MMKSIIAAMRDLPDFFALSGATEEQISAAEHALQTHFADDYRAYLAAYAIASANGHELTGLCNSARLDVVGVTKAERERHTAAHSDWYVIEQANIDGIVVWQSPKGTVYQTQPRADAIKLSENLLDYIR